MMMDNGIKIKDKGLAILFEESRKAAEESRRLARERFEMELFKARVLEGYVLDLVREE